MIPLSAPTRQNAPLLSELETRLKACLRAPVDEKTPFERELAAHQDYQGAVAAASLTDALEAALGALGLKAGTEVLVPALGTPEPVTAVLRRGLVPVFVDVDPATGCVDPRQVEKALTPRAGALIATASDGRRAPIADLVRLCRRYGLHAIEEGTDTAGLGALVDKMPLRAIAFPSGGPLGALGSVAAVLSDDRDLLEKLHGLPAPSALDLAMVRLKLPRLSAWTGMRRTVAAWYHRHLGAMVQRGLFSLPAESTGNAWGAFSLRVPRYRDEIAQCLKAKGVATGVPGQAVLPNRREFHAWSRGGFPAAERLSHEWLKVPLYPELTGKEFRHVVNSLAACTARLST